jgi:hypothetical protein
MVSQIPYVYNNLKEKRKRIKKGEIGNPLQSNHGVCLFINQYQLNYIENRLAE